MSEVPDPLDVMFEGDIGEFSEKRLARLKTEANAAYTKCSLTLNEIRRIADSLDGLTKQFHSEAGAYVRAIKAIETEHQMPRF